MKKSIYKSIFAFVCVSNIAFGQVGIGIESPHTSAVLDVVSSDKGFLAPQVELTATNVWAPLVNPATEGMLVYNTKTTSTNPATDVAPGYYFWADNKWQPTGLGSRTYVVSDGVIPSILGYTPNGIASSAASSVVVDGLTFTKRGCTQWTAGNGHYYCVYTSGNNGTSGSSPGTGGANWGTAYNVGKTLNGYLLTITSDAEETFVRNNIINGSNSGYGNLRNNIWIGNNKAINMSYSPANQPAPGIPIEFYWITGENSKHNWSNATTVQQNFASNANIQDEPNNLGNNEGCTHIWANGMSSGMDGLKLKWNDAPCDVTTFSPGGIAAEFRALNQLIIEFNQ
ncbi:C-type lectin domain-containing protein [Empedobacter falsenii]|uniref:C-type lectin domain-containing protein n=1 Tax=Empedobacter falsenii TaxID=343874 RepID=UPI001C562C5D|nr:C-type lectin domain-containing protein [Empedobacter falsenii]MBW1619046.1 C-type lectin domain-containing protein [Empedobacter falsenii]